jgi:membrane protease YdiL (CAAX protease family)
MLVLLAVAVSSHWSPILDLRQRVGEMVRQLFMGVSWLGLGTVSLAAGVGEELLFRGTLQVLAERWWGATVGLVVTSLIFGALHAMSRTYFTLATAVGLYLGWLAQHFDDLLAPIVAHSLYDCAALVVLMRMRSVGSGS